MKPDTTSSFTFFLNPDSDRYKAAKIVITLPIVDSNPPRAFERPITKPNISGIRTFSNTSPNLSKKDFSFFSFLSGSFFPFSFSLAASI
ncbi:MAG: hypothetical protein EBZ92_06655 [Actinobacteria bacterium]|nr:hypothetical protein [Actinomycetota bacterium]NDF90176.1 hypothetical protein [Actinomycetota bacterium]